MASDIVEPAPPTARSHDTGHWPTGAKLFLFLSAALLPLALIAIFATLRTTQIVNSEVRSRLRIASAESSRSVAIELSGDMTALRTAAAALSADEGDAPSCARVQGVFAQQQSRGASFAIRDADGRLVCGRELPTTTPPAAPGVIAASIVEGRGLVLAVGARRGGATAAAFFPQPFLRALSTPGGFAQDFAAAIVQDDMRLELHDMDTNGAIERRETNRVQLGLSGLEYEMQVRSAPISSPVLIAMLLPLLMWAAAAGVSWFVVDRLLIRPLRLLRANVAAFTPGEEIDTVGLRQVSAQEIRELGDTFRAISRTVAIHEAGLAEGLVRQTKLTREVHHRVKNNLQVISSLINFHARGARTPEATEAYSSIQRRVDALAVVHRNHFAEMEENRGLSLRSVLGELASNIRATAPDGTTLGVVLDIDPFLVTQDVAVAVAFIITETVELAMTCDPAAQVRISLKAAEAEGRALLRISARALTESEVLRDGLTQRYGRVMEGLSRQLRAPLHHDPLVGAFEISIAVVGRD